MSAWQSLSKYSEYLPKGLFSRTQRTHGRSVKRRTYVPRAGWKHNIRAQLVRARAQTSIHHLSLLYFDHCQVALTAYMLACMYTGKRDLPSAHTFRWLGVRVQHNVFENNSFHFWCTRTTCYHLQFKTTQSCRFRFHPEYNRLASEKRNEENPNLTRTQPRVRT